MSLEEHFDILKEQVVSLESRLVQLPDGATKATCFCPHSTLAVPVPLSNETQHEDSFQDYT
jgi:hypothetical protein